MLEKILHELKRQGSEIDLDEPFDRYPGGPNKGRIIWDDETNAIIASEYHLKKATGYSLDMPAQDRAVLVKEKIIQHENGPQKCLYDAGLESFMCNKTAVKNYFKKKGSPYYFFKWLDPELFNHKIPEHIHDWDFSRKDYWRSESRSRLAAEHMLFEKAGYSFSSDASERAGIVRTKIFNYRKQVSDGQDEKELKGSGLFLYDAGLISLIANKRGFIEKINSPFYFFKWFDPELFDYEKPGHLHEWEFSMDHYFDDEGKARKAADHIFHNHLLLDSKEQILQAAQSYARGPLRFLNDNHIKPIISHKRKYLKKVSSPTNFFEWYFK